MLEKAWSEFVHWIHDIWRRQVTCFLRVPNKKIESGKVLRLATFCNNSQPHCVVKDVVQLFFWHFLTILTLLRGLEQIAWETDIWRQRQGRWNAHARSEGLADANFERRFLTPGENSMRFRCFHDAGVGWRHWFSQAGGPNKTFNIHSKSFWSFWSDYGMPWGESTGSMKIWSILLEDTATAWIGPQVICKHIATCRNKKLDITLRGWPELGLTSLGSSKDSKEQRNRRPGDQLPWRCWTLTHLWFGNISYIVTSDKCCWKVGVSQHQVDFQEVKPGFHSLLLHHGTSKISKHPCFFFRRRKIWLRTFGKRWNLRTNRWRPRHAQWVLALAVFELFECQSLVGLRNFYGAAQGNCCVSRAVWHPDSSDSWGWSSTQPR